MLDAAAKSTFAFVLGSIVSFTISMFIQSDYMEGIGHVIVIALSTILFWIGSLIIIWFRFSKVEKSDKPIATFLVSFSLLLPLGVFLLLDGASFKIGG
jgi:hypothetical protein